MINRHRLCLVALLACQNLRWTLCWLIGMVKLRFHFHLRGPEIVNNVLSRMLHCGKRYIIGSQKALSSRTIVCWNFFVRKFQLSLLQRKVLPVVEQSWTNIGNLSDSLAWVRHKTSFSVDIFVSPQNWWSSYFFDNMQGLHRHSQIVKIITLVSLSEFLFVNFMVKRFFWMPSFKAAKTAPSQRLIVTSDKGTFMEHSQHQED